MILSACSNKLGEVKQVDVYKMESFDQVQKILSLRLNQMKK